MWCYWKLLIRQEWGKGGKYRQRRWAVYFIESDFCIARCKSFGGALKVGLRRQKREYYKLLLENVQVCEGAD
jgi:hypothetical protein